MKILISGGAGFVGSHLTDAFLDHGHSVSIIDNFSTGLLENVNPHAQLHRVDICDIDAVHKAFIDGELVAEKLFHVNEVGKVTNNHNPYFAIEHIKLFEGDANGWQQRNRKFLKRSIKKQRVMFGPK